MTNADEKSARAEICRVGQSLFARGYVHSTAGNISVRLDDGYLITPTDACLGFLQDDQVSKVSLDGRHISGDTPSKTLTMHRAIYDADASARCVIHTHSTHCVALTLKPLPLNHPVLGTQELLGAITPYFVMKVGHVPIIGYTRPGSAQASAEVVRLITLYRGHQLPIRAAMMERLGPIVWHQSIKHAMAALEELEETAKLQTLAPNAPPLDSDQLQELRASFGANW
jgi:3-dehydro-4-phosphotetronate decarboxylase